jgi:hypothetical protein
MKEGALDGACCTHRENRNECKVLAEKPERETSRLRRKMMLKCI